ncbi:hypothetical protein A4X13_0g2966 [Tilletia indica]|uniref:Uncharacterized protein n=1 Tax=Tilletia indica TaxID=43049 RepID=A0A177T8V5_9BASI|nr:hypothetical protein A4X13_0g2966 [Tilletia indica]
MATLDLARRAQVDFNATDLHPAYSHLNESSIAVLQNDANRIFSPVQVDGFSVSILVALFGMYLLTLTSIVIMRVFMRNRYLALPPLTRRQCSGFLASAMTMSVPAPLLGYALSAAKWDINMQQIRCLRLAAIIVCSFSLFDLIHRERFSMLILLQRTISLAAVSFQIYMFNQTQDPSFIVTLAALLFVSMTESPAFFGLFLYKLQFSAKWTKFVLRSAVGQTLFVKSAGVAVGAYTWTKFQRQNSTVLGKASSVVYLAALVGLLTCQVLTVIPLHKLAKEVDERYAMKGPLERSPSKSNGGGRSKGRRGRKGENDKGHLQGEDGKMRRFQNDRLSTFDMANLGRDSLEMDEKRQSEDIEIGSSYKSMSPAGYGPDQEWAPPTIRERLRALSPIGRKSPNFSRPLSEKKQKKSSVQGRSTADSHAGSSVAGTSKQGAQSPSTFGSKYSPEVRNVPILHFDGPNGRPQSEATDFGSERHSAEGPYNSPKVQRRILDDGNVNSYLRGEAQPQIIVSAASSTVDHRGSDYGSTLNDHSYPSGQGHTTIYQDDNWNRSHQSQHASSSNTPSSSQVTVNRITGFPPHQVATGPNSTEDTSRYALGIVQEYLEPSESAASSTWGRDADGAETSGRQSAVTDSAYTSEVDDRQQPQHTYTVPRSGQRPRQAPSGAGNQDQNQYYAQQQSQYDEESYQQESYSQQQQQQYHQQQQQQQRYKTDQYDDESNLQYSHAFNRAPATRGTQAPQFLADLG